MMMGLVKPSEIIVLILFILWGVTSWDSFKQKLVNIVISQKESFC